MKSKLENLRKFEMTKSETKNINGGAWTCYHGNGTPYASFINASDAIAWADQGGAGTGRYCVGVGADGPKVEFDKKK